jgi:hypothetical protein
MSGKTYIGDGVYAEFDGLMIKLTTERENGEHVIYLEPEVYGALAAYAKTVWKFEDGR